MAPLLATQTRVESLGRQPMLGTAPLSGAGPMLQTPLTTQEIEMSNQNRRHVVPNDNGGWDVKKPGSSRASAHTDTQAEAIDRAKDIVHNAGGREVRIHGRNGRIRDSDTVNPGNDPNPPRDKK